MLLVSCPLTFQGDFVTNGETFLAASDEDIAVVCGACIVTGDASTASKLVANVAVACGALVVAFATTFGGSWFL